MLFFGNNKIKWLSHFMMITVLLSGTSGYFQAINDHFDNQSNSNNNRTIDEIYFEQMGVQAS